MIRLAQTDDLTFITQGMLDLKQTTGWASYDQPGYNYCSLRTFLTERLCDPESVLYVSHDGNGNLTAFCGGSLNRFYLPPHMPLLFEWGWFGSPRECTECWLAVVQWGKQRGVELVGRVRSVRGTRKGKVIEQQVWKVLR